MPIHPHTPHTVQPGAEELQQLVQELHLLESCPAVAASSGRRSSCGGASRGRPTLCLLLLLLHARPGSLNALIFT